MVVVRRGHGRGFPEIVLANFSERLSCGQRFDLARKRERFTSSLTVPLLHVMKGFGLEAYGRWSAHWDPEETMVDLCNEEIRCRLFSVQRLSTSLQPSFLT